MAAGLRAERDPSNEKLGYKLRVAQLEKIPYMGVVGEREQRNGTVAARQRSGDSLPPMGVDEFIARVVNESQPGGEVTDKTL